MKNKRKRNVKEIKWADRREDTKEWREREDNNRRNGGWKRRKNGRKKEK